MANINDRQRLINENSGFKTMSNYASAMASGRHIMSDSNILMTSTPFGQAAPRRLDGSIAEEARARINADTDIDTVLSERIDALSSHISEASSNSRRISEDMQGALLHGQSFQYMRPQYTPFIQGVPPVIPQHIAATAQFIIDDLEPQAAESEAEEVELDNSIEEEESVKFIVVPENKFVKLEDYNQLAQLVVQLNEKVSFLENEKIRIENNLTVRQYDNERFNRELRTYVDMKTGNLHQLLGEEIAADRAKYENFVMIHESNFEYIKLKE